MVDFYSQFLSLGDLCFDVGANIGNRVKVFLELGAKVVAVEPQHDCVKVLTSCFHQNLDLAIVPKALGKTKGEALIYVSKVNVLTSLSRDWIDTVKESGRSTKNYWAPEKTVELSTLNELISTYGSPKFIKIDVEGYEFEVIQGLSEPIEALSIEFTPEFSESTFNSMNYLSTLGTYETNFSKGESFAYDFQGWVSVEEMITYLKQFLSIHEFLGDVYLRITN